MAAHYSRHAARAGGPCTAPRARDRVRSAPIRSAFQDEQLQLSTLLHAAPEGIPYVSHDGAILFANDRACLLFGYPRTKLIGLPNEAIRLEAIRRILPLDALPEAILKA